MTFVSATLLGPPIDLGGSLGEDFWFLFASVHMNYLGGENGPTERVRCPVHGFIRYSKNERTVIDHWAFQPLRHVRQLAMEYLVYPGGVHTRFEHSLGVMELGTRAFDHLLRRHRDVIEADLRTVPQLSEDTIPKARQLVRLMGLLHDVGHPAFAHASARTDARQDVFPRCFEGAGSAHGKGAGTSFPEPVGLWRT